MVAAVRAAASGDAVLSRSVARRVVERLPHQQVVSRSAAVEGLTEREQEVLTLIADGCSNAEIAQRLHIVEGTVKTHVARILCRAGAADRLQAVVAAYRAGLVAPHRRPSPEKARRATSSCQGSFDLLAPRRHYAASIGCSATPRGARPMGRTRHHAT